LVLHVVTASGLPVAVMSPEASRRRIVAEQGWDTLREERMDQGIGRVLDALEKTGQRSQLIDLMATFVDVSGAAYPKTFNGQGIAELPGKSLLPIFQGGKLEDRPLFFEHEGNRAVYRGDWKLVAQHQHPWSLYQIRQDRTEVHHVAADHPDIAAALVEQYEAWATENYVLAWPARESALAQTAQ
jgi:arylsulfatase A-like enzyme